jgi:hypothetical protein
MPAGSRPKRNTKAKKRLGEDSPTPAPSRRSSGARKAAKVAPAPDLHGVKIRLELGEGSGTRIKANEGRIELTSIKIDRDDLPPFDDFWVDVVDELDAAGVIQDARHQDRRYQARLFVATKTRDGKAFDLIGISTDAHFATMVEDHDPDEKYMTLALRFVLKASAQKRKEVTPPASEVTPPKSPAASAPGDPPPAPKLRKKMAVPAEAKKPAGAHASTRHAWPASPALALSCSRAAVG